MPKMGSWMVFKSSSSVKVAGSIAKSIPAISAQTCAPFWSSLQLHWLDLREVDISTTTNQFLPWCWHWEFGPFAHQLHKVMQACCHDFFLRIWEPWFQKPAKSRKGWCQTIMLPTSHGAQLGTNWKIIYKLNCRWNFWSNKVFLSMFWGRPLALYHIRKWLLWDTHIAYHPVLAYRQHILPTFHRFTAFVAEVSRRGSMLGCMHQLASSIRPSKAAKTAKDLYEKQQVVWSNQHGQGHGHQIRFPRPWNIPKIWGKKWHWELNQKAIFYCISERVANGIWTHFERLLNALRTGTGLNGYGYAKILHFRVRILRIWTGSNGFEWFWTGLNGSERIGIPKYLKSPKKTKKKHNHNYIGILWSHFVVVSAHMSMMTQDPRPG